MTAPRVLTVPLGGTPLSRAAQEGRTPASWYVPRPRTPDEWRQRLTAVREASAGDWRGALGPAIAAAGAAAARLDAAAGGRGVVLTTGQQPGLFGGPLYTWTKALGTAALADALQEATGIPVAPVFWAATDDSDFAEARSTVIAVPGGAETLRMSDPPDGGEGRPMSAVPLGDLSPLLAQLARGAGSGSYAAAFDALRACYAAGETVGGAYLRLLRTLLEPFGMAVVDASHQALRAAADPFLRRALREAGAIDAAAHQRIAELAAAGFEAQVHEVAGLSLVFELAGGTRHRVPLPRAADAAVAAPAGALGANVLLRPVIERALLPTAGYLAGPGEIAYFAQVGPVAGALSLEAPLAIPRWSATIVEPHVARILERRGVSVDDLADPHAVETRIARGALPEPVANALHALRDAVELHTTVLSNFSATRHHALVDARVVQGARGALEHRLDRLERRYVAALKRRAEDVHRDLATARGALWPDGVRQERALNLFPLLARHGPGLLDAMRAAAAAWARGVVRGEPGPTDATADVTAHPGEARPGVRA